MKILPTPCPLGSVSKKVNRLVISCDEKKRWLSQLARGFRVAIETHPLYNRYEDTLICGDCSLSPSLFRAVFAREHKNSTGHLLCEGKPPGKKCGCAVVNIPRNRKVIARHSPVDVFHTWRVVRASKKFV